MVNFLKSFWTGFLNLFGFSKNSRYVKTYLNDANMRSGIFMSSVIVVLEIWLVIRQTNKYVMPALDGGAETFNTIFSYLWTYFLLLSYGAAMFVYCLQYIKRGKSILMVILTTVFAGISLALCCFMPFEFKYHSIKFTSSVNTIKGVFKILFYAAIVLFNIAIIFATIYRYKGGNRPSISSVLVISLFALVCLLFGIMISYGDFVSGAKFDSGEYQHKQIICFLMMSMYVGCLLIWKPLISIGILGSIFLGFYFALNGVVNHGGRELPEGDEVNYITFFISLTMICISIYNQRISEAKKDEELELLATKDTLTGLYTFGYFITLANRKIKEEQLKEGEWIYLFLNITSFKIFNDQKGFTKGNEFLNNVGIILSDVFQNSLISRQSDDHFFVFTKNEDVEKKIQIINERTEEQDLDIRPGIKVGGYILKDKDEDSHRAAEKARYACAELESKHSSDSFLIYDTAMHDNYRMVQYIVRHIDEAVEQGYIKAYYQPVVWSKGRELCGAEALARWIDPKYGFLSPGKFVPALESAQLVYKLDIAMLRIVCKDIRYNLDNKLPVLPVSINFSRADFGVIDVVKVIDDTITEFNIPHELFHVEITESALMDDEVLLKDAISRLHGLGYAVWLDDFGSGYSSFNVLKDYDFDVLKLDMKFLSGFKENEKSKALIQSVVQMADQIGIKTLSEGVETKDEAEFLEKICCGRLQGYLYGKPLPYEELLGKIQSGEYKLSKDIIQ